MSQPASTALGTSSARACNMRRARLQPACIVPSQACLAHLTYIEGVAVPETCIASAEQPLTEEEEACHGCRVGSPEGSAGVASVSGEGNSLIDYFLCYFALSAAYDNTYIGQGSVGDKA